MYAWILNLIETPILLFQFVFYVLRMLFLLLLNLLCISWGHNGTSYEGVYGNENATRERRPYYNNITCGKWTRIINRIKAFLTPQTQNTVCGN